MTTSQYHIKSKISGVIFDSSLSLSEQVNHLIKCMYIEIRKISKILHLAPMKITELLVNSLVLWRLDYCNSLRSNVSKSKLKSLQVVQNNAARLILKKKRSDSATPLLTYLHWLPVEKRIIYKICTIVYKSMNTDCPGYINDMISLYTPSRNLRSSKYTTLLVKPKIHRIIGKQSFIFSAPHFWNSLPRHIRCSHSLQTFKSQLKYYLFTV